MPADPITASTVESGPLAEISQGPNKLDQFMDQHSKKLIILAILLVIAIAAFMVIRELARSKRIEAGEQLVAAESVAGLRGVIAEFPESPAAGSARMLLAQRQWLDGDREDAVSTLRQMIEETPNHPAVPSARAMLGTKLLELGNPDQAKQTFEALAEIPEAAYIAPYGLIIEGDIARNAGDTEAARKFYERARNEFPLNELVEQANRRLAVLDAVAPVEIAAPEPAEGSPAGLETEDVPAVEFPLTNPAPGANSNLFDQAPEIETTDERVAPEEAQAPEAATEPVEPEELPADAADTPLEEVLEEAAPAEPDTSEEAAPESPEP